MQHFQAIVKNGRLVLDAPTDLPEGEVVELVVADGDDLDDEERAALHAALDASVAAAKAGQVCDADQLLDELDAELRSGS